MSLLTIVQNATQVLALEQPSSVINTSNADVLQLLGLLRIGTRQLVTRHQWTALRYEANFTTVAAEDQGAIATLAPEGFDYIVHNTIYSRSQIWTIPGPYTAQGVQRDKAASVTGPYPIYRIERDKLLLYPAPTAGEDYYFYYMSKNHCESSGGTGRSVWTADDDVSRLDEDLLELDLIWRWRHAKGFDYSEDKETCEIQIAQAMARDGGSTTLNLDGPVNPRPTVSVPDASWPL